MATFKYEIFKDRKRIDGTYNVKIRVTHNRKLKRIPTSIYVTKEDITKGFKIKNQSILDDSAQWLLTGKGEMFKSSSPKEELTPITNERLLSIIESQQRTIENLSKK